VAAGAAQKVPQRLEAAVLVEAVLAALVPPRQHLEPPTQEAAVAVDGLIQFQHQAQAAQASSS
jgi:hypothetical protein